MSEKSEKPQSLVAKKQPAWSLATAYFVARIGIFVALLAIFWWLGFTGLPGALAAAIISIPLSFFALSKMRVRVAEAMAERRSEKVDFRDEFTIDESKDA